MEMLKKLREARGISQEQLAEGLQKLTGEEWSQVYISRYESGKVMPPDDRIKQLAKFFGVTPAVVRGEEAPGTIDGRIHDLLSALCTSALNNVKTNKTANEILANAQKTMIDYFWPEVERGQSITIEEVERLARVLLNRKEC